MNTVYVVNWRNIKALNWRIVLYIQHAPNRDYVGTRSKMFSVFVMTIIDAPFDFVAINNFIDYITIRYYVT